MERFPAVSIGVTEARRVPLWTLEYFVPASSCLFAGPAPKELTTSMGAIVSRSPFVASVRVVGQPDTI
jgi:hypothetical protein